MNQADDHARLRRLLDLCRAQVPRHRLVDRRDSPLMRIAALLVWPLNPSFLSGYTTVIGATVYLPGRLDQLSPRVVAQLLAHELVHQRDQQRYGLWFYVSYALCPLPVWRTARARWERRAYAVDLLLAQADGGEAGLRREQQRLEAIFAGPAYGWMWGGHAAARAFLAPTVAAVRDGSLAQRAPYAAILAAWSGGAAADTSVRTRGDA